MQHKYLQRDNAKLLQRMQLHNRLDHQQCTVNTHNFDRRPTMRSALDQCSMSVPALCYRQRLGFFWNTIPEKLDEHCNARQVQPVIWLMMDYKLQLSMKKSGCPPATQPASLNQRVSQKTSMMIRLPSTSATSQFKGSESPTLLKLSIEGKWWHR